MTHDPHSVSAGVTGVFALLLVAMILCLALELNLQSHPEAHVQFGRERVAVKASEVSGAERAAMWSKLEESYPYFDTYRQRTERRIPVVVLDRTEQTAG